MSQTPLVRTSHRGSVREPAFVDVRGPGTVFGFDPPESLTKEVLKLEAAQVGDFDWLSKADPPAWIKELIRTGVSPEDIVNTLKRRWKELPDLRHAVLVLHELARLGYRPLVIDALREWAATSMGGSKRGK